MWRQKTLDERGPEPELHDEPLLALVDDALRVARGRQLFTREEALALLRRVGSEVEDPGRAASVERIVAGADADSAEQVMVSRTDLVDPLLDIRLVLSS